MGPASKLCDFDWVWDTHPFTPPQPGIVFVLLTVETTFHYMRCLLTCLFIIGSCHQVPLQQFQEDVSVSSLCFLTPLSLFLSFLHLNFSLLTVDWHFFSRHRREKHAGVKNPHHRTCEETGQIIHSNRQGADSYEQFILFSVSLGCEELHTLRHIQLADKTVLIVAHGSICNLLKNVFFSTRLKLLWLS